MEEIYRAQLSTWGGLRAFTNSHFKDVSRKAAPILRAAEATLITLTQLPQLAGEQWAVM